MFVRVSVYVSQGVLFPLSVRHEAALWRSDWQHVSGEDHQPGEAYRDLQPGCSESRQGSVIPQTHLQHSHRSLICATHSVPPDGVYLSDTTFPINIVNLLPVPWNHCIWVCFEEPDGRKELITVLITVNTVIKTIHCNHGEFETVLLDWKWHTTFIITHQK